MFLPFKGHKNGLSKKNYWNYIQISIRLCIKRSFGLLKGCWRILLKKLDMHLRMVPNIVGAYIILHNIFILHIDTFHEEWLGEA
jgi:hypothetical protein